LQADFLLTLAVPASGRNFRQTGYALGSSVAIVVLHEREPVAQAALH